MAKLFHGIIIALFFLAGYRNYKQRNIDHLKRCMDKTYSKN